jgi:hypothetical protein
VLTNRPGLGLEIVETELQRRMIPWRGGAGHVSGI